jgi:tRNA-specific 2-thiouridylase
LGISGQEYHRSFLAEDLNWMAIPDLTEPMQLSVKIRYGGKPVPATVTPLKDGSVRVDFDTPQRAVTPGQSAVFYRDNLLIGGGEIKSGALV